MQIRHVSWLVSSSWWWKFGERKARIKKIQTSNNNFACTNWMSRPREIVIKQLSFVYYQSKKASGILWNYLMIRRKTIRVCTEFQNEKDGGSLDSVQLMFSFRLSWRTIKKPSHLWTTTRPWIKDNLHYSHPPIDEIRFGLVLPIRFIQFYATYLYSSDQLLSSIFLSICLYLVSRSY